MTGKKVKPRQHHPSHSLKYGSNYVRCVLCGASGEQLYRPCKAMARLKEMGREEVELPQARPPKPSQRIWKV